MGWFTIIAAVISVWLWRAYFRPFADCGRCNGTGKKRGGRRFRRCWRCKGTGSRQVLGSKQVHKAAAAIRGATRKDKS